jgi:hypothetical protein
MTHALTGKWCLTSTEGNVESFMRATGCSAEAAKKWLPALTTTGEHGHIEEYMIDLNHKAVRRRTYCNDHLIREIMVPLDTESPGWSYGKFMRYKLHVDGLNKMTRSETGDNYTLTACAEVTGDSLATTWTCNDATLVLRFKRMH